MPKKHCTLNHLRKTFLEVQKPPQAPMPGHRKWGTKQAFRKRAVQLHNKLDEEDQNGTCSLLFRVLWQTCHQSHLQLRPRERGNSEETDIRRPAVLQAGNGPKKWVARGFLSCFFKLPKRPVSGLCRRPCQRFPPQAIRNQGSDKRWWGAGGYVVMWWWSLFLWRSLLSLSLDSFPVNTKASMQLKFQV